MPMTRLLATTLLLALASGADAQDKGKKLYCWNENGRKVCGDALPATAVDSARTEISAKSGLPTGRLYCSRCIPTGLHACCDSSMYNSRSTIPNLH